MTKIKMRDIVGVADTNVRKFTGLVDVTNLANSLEKGGLIHAIVVRPKKGKYEVVVGQRRYLAAKQLGMKEISATVEEMSDKEARVKSFSENVVREDLNPMERAEAIDAMLPDFGRSITKMAREIGIPHSTLSEWYSILSLKEMFKRVRRNATELPYYKQREIARIFPTNVKKQAELAGAVWDLRPIETEKVFERVKSHQREPIAEARKKALPPIEVEPWTEKMASDIADKIKDALISIAKEAEVKKTAGRGGLMRNYLFQGSIIKSLETGAIFDPDHPKEKMLHWPCRTPLSKSHEKLKKRLGIKNG